MALLCRLTNSQMRVYCKKRRCKPFNCTFASREVRVLGGKKTVRKSQEIDRPKTLDRTHITGSTTRSRSSGVLQHIISWLRGGHMTRKQLQFTRDNHHYGGNKWSSRRTRSESAVEWNWSKVMEWSAIASDLQLIGDVRCWFRNAFLSTKSGILITPD